MLPTTIDATRAILKADTTLDPGDRNRILTAIRTVGRTIPPPETPVVVAERIIRRAEAAARWGCSLRTIDALATAGTLRRVKLPGRVRGAGFRESDLLKLMEGTA